ncbi:DNA-directed RNA polymerase subunit sigma [Bacillus sp. FJAT-27231]|nr:DNA-directed RNA polymerase subunit sigma [Bacillus sp. FJAT-27231]
MYDQYFDDMYRYIYVKTGNKWDTEDIVSEAFRKAYERFDSLQEETNHKAWLMTIARNTVIDYYRKKKNVLVGEDIELYTAPIPFDDPLEQVDELNCLKKSLQHLPREEMDIVNLRYFADMRFKEIAAVLQKPDNSIRVKTGRITKKIGLLIKKCLGEA